MIAVLLLSLAAAPPPWVEQAFMGRPGSRWTAQVVMDRPGPGEGTDTGRACRDGLSERLDFRYGSHFLAGDSAVFLDAVSHVAWVGPRRRFPTPPDARFEIVGSERLLGRDVLVAEIRGPHGGGRRLWIDTILPLVLRTEPLVRAANGRGAPPERQFLSIQPGIPCPASDFRIPQGWGIRRGPPPRPPRADGRSNSAHRRHEAASAQALAQMIDFTPPPPRWLPAGFTAKSWAWIETRQGKAAQILYEDGSRKISVFFRPVGNEPPPFCPPSGCKDREGRAVYFGRSGNFSLVATGDLPAEQMERVVGNRK